MFPLIFKQIFHLVQRIDQMLHSFIFSGAPNEYTIYMNMHTRNPYFLVIFKTPSALLLY